MVMTKGNMLCGKKKDTKNNFVVGVISHLFLTRNTCMVGPPEARGRPLKCQGWKGGREIEEIV